MKLWLLDADIVIDFLSLEVFDPLVKKHEIHVASTVINEIKYYKRGEEKFQIDFREKYVTSNLVKELSATYEEMRDLLSKLPLIFRDTLDTGELESLTILYHRRELAFCSCDAAAIRVLPFLDLSERGISAESLLSMSGLTRKNLNPNHTDDYFKTNLRKGEEEKIYKFGEDPPK
ncbi:MAG: hypothetical protein QME90_09210 [Thermodesulfobacteriota bacterium]|nr:hypothetical protein [Thermodesulfobacteriota bacterium]